MVLVPIVMREYKGYVSTERAEIRKNRIIHSLLENAKTYTQLYNELGKKRKDRSGWSRRDFTQYVKELEKDFVIGKVKSKGKDRYMLLETSLGNDYTMMKKMYDWDRKVWSKKDELIETITKQPSPENVEGLITVFVLHNLKEYLEGVRSIALTSEKLRGYVRWFLARQTDRFGEIIVAFGQKCPETTEKVLESIKKMLSPT